ncbi:MAG: ComEC/Rec2 family competence protein [Candidatus Shapirobacteria bacterium]
MNDLKTKLIYEILSNLPNQQGSMLVAMLWGDVSGVSKEFYNQMVVTGLIHILVVSGSNLMIVVKGIIEFLAEWIGRKRSIVIGILIGWIYVNLVGFEMPATRAIVMVTVMYFSQFLGRRTNFFRMLLLVLLIMVLADYRVLGSTSFWMSFLAFIAVSQNTNEGILKTTLRVNLWLLPILAWKFGSISLVAPLSNLMTLFLVETITVLGFVGTIFHPILWLVYPLLVYIQKIVEILSIPHWAQVNISFNTWMMAGSYMIIGGYYMKKHHV